jgi:membrane protease YdiL (CAAX protease family)
VELRYFTRIALGVDAISGTGGLGGGAAGVGAIETQAASVARNPLAQARAAVTVFHASGWDAAERMLNAARGSLAVYEDALADPAAIPEEPPTWGLGDPTPLTRGEAEKMAAEPDKTRQWIDALREDIDVFEQLLDPAASGADALSADARDRLIDRHGWFAKAALIAHAERSDPLARELRRNAVVTLALIVGLIGVGGLAVLLGLGFGVVGVVLVARGVIRPRARWRQLALPATVRGAMLESVAVFLVGFVAVSFGAGLVAQALKLSPTRVSMLAQWLLLPVVLWPLVRGVRWSEWRAATGWHAGGVGLGPLLREAGLGVAGYLAMLPIVVSAVLLSLLIVSMTGAQPSHPAVAEALAGDALTIALIYLLATVWAPIVEETVFRGAMYAALRPVVPTLLSALITGVLFAAIHPQGIALVPALASIGFVLAIIREWRGSIVGPIAAHAMHNGFIITLAVVIVS